MHSWLVSCCGGVSPACRAPGVHRMVAVRFFASNGDVCSMHVRFCTGGRKKEHGLRQAQAMLGQALSGSVRAGGRQGGGGGRGRGVEGAGGGGGAGAPPSAGGW